MKQKADTRAEEINLGGNVVLIYSYTYCMSSAFFVLSVIDDTTKEIVYRDYVDISVAVATPKVRQVHYTVKSKCLMAHSSLM